MYLLFTDILFILSASSVHMFRTCEHVFRSCEYRFCIFSLLHAFYLDGTRRIVYYILLIFALTGA